MKKVVLQETICYHRKGGEKMKKKNRKKEREKEENDGFSLRRKGGSESARQKE